MAGYDNLHPVFRERLQKLNAAAGTHVVSGYRSSQRQGELYRGWKERRKGFNPANPPGTSNHEAIPNGPPQGLAADIGGNLTKARELARSFGIHFPIPGERWHCQPVEVGSGKFTGVPNMGGGNVAGGSNVSNFPGVMRVGAKGNGVRMFQQKLKDRGWSITPDGDFGPKTDKIVKQFQKEKGLVQDGVVGPKTWTAIWS